MSQIVLSPNASGTGQFTIASPNSNTNRTVDLPDAAGTMVLDTATQTLTNKTIQGGALTLATAQASTSGTSIDFTGIPSWVKRITVMFSGVSTSGTSILQIQLGYSGGIETSGYDGVCNNSNGSVVNNFTAGFQITTSVVAAGIYQGQMMLSLVTGNTWSETSSFGRSDSASFFEGCGTKTLSATLTQVRITTVNGTDTFDAGTINIMYEG
jgi:hypothetical protein